MEWINDNPWAFWLIVAAMLLVAEVLITDFTAFVFAIGASTASAVAYAGGEWWAQLAAMATVTVLLYIFVRPKLTAFLNRNVTELKHGQDRLIGLDAKVIQSNRVEVSHQGVEVWTARTVNSEPLIPGSFVTIERVDGSSLIVRTK